MTSANPTDAHPSIAEYLAGAGVEATPVEAGTAGAPVVTIAVPGGWQQVPAQLFPGAYGVWTQAPEGGWADNAVVLVVKFSKAVDAKELLSFAFGDARRLPEWRDSETDIADFGGFPSAGITGNYKVEPFQLWTYHRYVVVENGAEQYLVQLTVTIRDDHDGADAATVIEGLSVSV
ncbi:LpqN/LpqT family lipoprotein [Nocardia inohanensis]|uniref:LpqN/LpqT family lipoprotein n=1 Tax=Nocardia inohanensis TaxID=209246 RepID=UPI000A8A37AA|nr:LpqN/LpqT family lipoprotein [Nocardia inohanensis]